MNGHKYDNVESNSLLNTEVGKMSDKVVHEWTDAMDNKHRIVDESTHFLYNEALDGTNWYSPKEQALPANRELARLAERNKELEAENKKLDDWGRAMDKKIGELEAVADAAVKFGENKVYWDVVHKALKKAGKLND